MSVKLKLFSDVGIVSQSTLSTNVRAYVMFSMNGSNIIGKCSAVTGITITQAADLNVTKSLAGDFLISVFGDTPVSINLTGLEILTTQCTGTSLVSGASSVMLVFDKYKVSANNKNRMTVSIYNYKRKIAKFKCIISSMSELTTSRSIQQGTSAYTMQLIGVAVS